MNKNNSQKNKACSAKLERSRGFVLLFAVTLAAIFLSIALGATSIALKEINFGTSAIDTNNAFYAADIGTQCALMYSNSLLGSTHNAFDGGAHNIFCDDNINIQATSPFWTFYVSALN